MSAGRDHLGFHETLERRTRRRERRQTIVGRVIGRVVVRQRTGGDDVRHVAGHVDRHRVGAFIPRRRDHHDPGAPGGHDGLVDRIVPVIGLRLRAEREIQDADVVSRAVRENPVQARDHIGVAAASLAVERPHDDQIGPRSNTVVAE